MPVRLTRALSPAFLFVSLALLPSADCLNGQASPHVSLVFRNSNPSVAYVGSATCTVPGCHQDIGPTYAQSPHGQSMAPANSAGELARAPQPITVFNRKNGRYYTVYQEGGNLYQSAYELDKAGHRLNATAHKIDYVAGGQRTGYSYLFRIGAWIFQAPLSYYAPSKTWELSPGYVADDPGFTRGMTTGCLVCHNGQPDPVARRDGMYKEPPFRFGELGISCEACHGPGALHVKEMQNQKGRVLGPGEVDTSIVNPARLSPRLADDICRECHQAGDAVVLMPGKADLDFPPGTPLADTMAIVKRPIKAEQREEANRLERNPPVRGSLEQPLWWKNSTLELSKCYQASNGQLTCSTCHSTHHAPRPEDEKAAYRAVCLSCTSRAAAHSSLATASGLRLETTASHATWKGGRWPALRTPTIPSIVSCASPASRCPRLRLNSRIPAFPACCGSTVPQTRRCFRARRNFKRIGPWPAKIQACGPSGSASSTN